jgi:hypothetical protein
MSSHKPKILEDRECVGCGITFKPNRDNRKYCTSKCQHKNNRKKHYHKTIVNNIVENGDFKGANRSYAIKKGLEDAKRILSCSTECLLEELGDIE